MPILKLIPACKDYLWGGSKLREEYNIRSDLEPLAEAWVLSCHKDGPSTVANGPDAGLTLPAYIEKHGKEVLGVNCARFEEFPILGKFIDAKGDLSIQVHPDNAYALAHEGQFGKTEMWYVLEAEPGAFLYYGFKHPITKEEYKARIENNTLTEVLNAAPVHRGDVFFIPAGTLHAICKGIVIAEIQQNSNVTYRVYDYGRLGADGKPRQLHVEQALEVTRCVPPSPQDFGGHLAACEYFTADLARGGAEGMCDESSFTSLLITDGAGALACGGEELAVRKGDSLFLPAGSGEWKLTGAISALVCRVPPRH